MRMPSSARAVFIDPDAWDRTALQWFTAVAVGSAACVSAETSVPPSGRALAESKEPGHGLGRVV
jgi:hypothetical protein